MTVLTPGPADRPDVLDTRLDRMGINNTAYNWYCDSRRHGRVPHAGFGLGFERAVSPVAGMGNVRDAVPFPRVARISELHRGWFRATFIDSPS